MHGGTRNFRFWSLELSRKALEHDMAEDPARMTAAFATFTTAFHDTHVACWDSKSAYRFIRPSQLDPSLPTLVPVPAHPSYASAYSCLSAAGTVLEAVFPADAPRFADMRRGASEARLVAGLHLRIDCDAGEEIGRRAAALTVARLGAVLRPH